MLATRPSFLLGYFGVAIVSIVGQDNPFIYIGIILLAYLGIVWIDLLVYYAYLKGKMKSLCKEYEKTLKPSGPWEMGSTLPPIKDS